MPITAFYAALVAALFIVLSWRTIATRREAGVEIGDGRNDALLRRMRVHANCAEYAPIAIVLMALAESLGLVAPVLHVIGAVLLGGRVVHAYALSQSPHVLPLRVAGMVATFTAMIVALLACLALAVPRIF